jgi:adenylate cyclase
MVAMRREDGTYAKPQVKKSVKASAPPNWMWPVAVTVVCLFAIGVGGFLYFTKLELGSGPKGPEIASSAASPSPSPSSAAVPAPAATTAAPASAPPRPSAAPPAVAAGEKSSGFIDSVHQ